MLGLTVALFFQGNKVGGEERSFWIEVKNQLRYKLQNKDINYLNSLQKETQITPVARQEIDRQAFLKMQQEYNKYKLSEIDKKNNGLL